MNGLSRIKLVNLRERVAEQIRTAIIEGRLKPNDHIVEAVITEQLGVSRTPVREALILLEREALIVTVPHRGAFVRAFNEEDVWAIFSMRTTLENFTAELIIDKFTDADHAHLESLNYLQLEYIKQRDFKRVRSTDMAFHQYMVEASGHPMLKRNWQEIVAQIAALLHVRAEAFPEYDEYLAIRDHQTLIDAYRKRDIEALRAANQRINARIIGECVAAVRVKK